MERFTKAVESAISSRNYYGALLLAVTLPDIAGAIMMPNENIAGRRYKAWWKKYMLPTYSAQIGELSEEMHVFLGASDAWALRCAILHSGSDVIEGEKASESLDRFWFKQPPNSTVHLNQADRALNLQVSEFAEDILDGVRQFLLDYGDAASAAKLVTIDFSDSFSM